LIKDLSPMIKVDSPMLNDRFPMIIFFQQSPFWALLLPPQSPGTPPKARSSCLDGSRRIRSIRKGAEGLKVSVEKIY
jgi:hypothetical protein